MLGPVVRVGEVALQMVASRAISVIFSEVMTLVERAQPYIEVQHGFNDTRQGRAVPFR